MGRILGRMRLRLGRGASLSAPPITAERPAGATGGAHSQRASTVATIAAMSFKETLKQLEVLGNEKMRAQNTKHGAGENQFGVRRGDVRKLAKKIKTNHELALALWETGNIDARFLAILLMKPRPFPSTRWIGWCGPSRLSRWRTGSTPTSSSTIPTRRRFARGGWPRTTPLLGLSTTSLQCMYRSDECRGAQSAENDV